MPNILICGNLQVETSLGLRTTGNQNKVGDIFHSRPECSTATVSNDMFRTEECTAASGEYRNFRMERGIRQFGLHDSLVTKESIPNTNVACCHVTHFSINMNVRNGHGRVDTSRIEWQAQYRSGGTTFVVGRTLQQVSMKTKACGLNNEIVFSVAAVV